MIQAVGENPDLICFAVVLLVGFGIKHLAFPRFRLKRLIVGDFLFAVLVIVVTAQMLSISANREQRSLERIVDALLPTFGFELERLGHAELAPSGTTPQHTTLQEVSQHWDQVNELISGLFTVRKEEAGLQPVISTLDQLPPLPEPVEQGFESGKGHQTLSDFTPPHLFAWHPLHNSNGEVEALLVTRFDASPFLRSKRQSRGRIFATFATVALLFGAYTGVLALQYAARRRQRESQRALIQSEQRLALHLKQTPLAAIEWDLNFTVRQWNPSAERIFGYTHAEALHRSGYDLVIPENLHTAMGAIWADLIEHGTPRMTRLDGRTRDGRLLTCEWFHTPLVDVEGRIIGAASLCLDITEQLRLEAELQQSRKLQSIGNVSAMIAHDFNNILSVINGHADLIQQSDDPLPPAVIESAQEITLAIQKASHLTRQLLTFSRKQRMNMTALEVNPFITALLRSTQPALGGAIQLEKELNQPLPQIEGDPVMLEQALVNLMLNARDAMPGGGTLKVTTRLRTVSESTAAAHHDVRSGRFVEIAVSDTGTGIDPDQIPLLFEPFFTTKPPEKGSGLGLAAVYGVIKQHNGWIEISSEPGSGTIFRLLLPVVEG